MKYPSTESTRFTRAALLSVLLLAGCNGGSSDPADEDPTTARPPASPTGPTTTPPEDSSPDTEGPGTEGPDMEGPGTEGPGTEGPGTEGPGTEEPGTEEPGTEGPGTEDPGTEGPGTEGPDSIRTVIPGVDVLFGQPIEEIPVPIVSPGTRFFDWQYDVVDDQLSSSNYTAPDSHVAAWQSFASLIPPRFRQSVDSVTIVFDLDARQAAQTATVSISGYEEVPGKERATLNLNAALVTAIYEWSLASGPGTVSREHAYLWVHETGHLTEGRHTVELRGLGDEYYDTSLWGVVPPAGLGTAKTSPIGRYYERFWLGDIADYYVSLGDAPNRQDALYRAYPDSFVTYYAATNFHEDFAESLMTFVMVDEMPPADGTRRTEKIRWFWSWPDMVQFRDEIRARL